MNTLSKGEGKIYCIKSRKYTESTENLLNSETVRKYRKTPLKCHIFLIKYQFFLLFGLSVEVMMKKYLRNKNQLTY